MNIGIVDVLRRGLRRTVARNGLMLVAATYLLTAPKALFAPQPAESSSGTGGMALADPVVGDSILLGVAITFCLLVASTYVVVVAFRTFATDETETIPADAHPDHPLWTVANVMVGFTVSIVLAAIGSVFFIVPGLALLVGLWFFDLFVAIDGDDFRTGYRRSWALASGHKRRLFALGCLVVATWIVLTLPFLLLQFAIGGLVGQFVLQLPIAFCLVTTYATTTTAFTALRNTGDPARPTSRGEPEPTAEKPDPTEPIGRR